MPAQHVETLRGVRIVLRPRPRAERGRTLDQRIAVEFPWIYRAGVRSVNRLPLRSRLRQWAVARGVALAYAAANRRDFELVLLTFSPELEYRPSPDLMPPDLEPTFHGYDGYLRLWRYWLDAFADIRWEPEEMIDFGDAMLVTVRQSGTGSGSGIAVS